MTFGLKSLAEKFTGSKSVTNIFNSPIWVSILISFIMVLIIYTLWKDDLDDIEFVPFIFRTFVYVLVGTMAVVFLHNQTLIKKYQSMNGLGQISNIISTNNEDIKILNANRIAIEPSI